MFKNKNSLMDRFRVSSYNGANDMMNDIPMEVNIKSILMSKFVSLSRMVESSEVWRT